MTDRLSFMAGRASPPRLARPAGAPPLLAGSLGALASLACSRITLARVAAAVALAAAAPSALAGSSVHFSGSAYVEEWHVLSEAARGHATQGVIPAASIKLSTDITDDLSFSAKACVGCHGVEMEHVALDYTPRTWFNMQVGRITVPFGDYSQRVDPSGHKAASPPLIYDMGQMVFGERTAMNLGVLPLPYTDTGALVYGVKYLGESFQLWYGLFGVSGLRGASDADWTAMRTAPYTDSNGEPGGGARMTMTYSANAGSFFGDASIGGSFTAGRYDRDARLKYGIWGADATFRLGPFTLRGEYAARRTWIDPDASGYRYQVIDPWVQKEGFYAEVEHPLGEYLAAIYRYDELRRAGVPSPGANALLSVDSRMKRYTGGLMITPAQSLFLKLSWEYWDTTDLGRFQAFHAGLGGAF